MRTRHAFQLILMFSAAPVLQPATSVAAQDPVARELTRLEDTWAAGEGKKDREGISKLLAGDFMITDGTGRLLTREEYLSSVAKDTTPVVSETQSDYRVRVFGNTAIVSGMNTLVRKGSAGNQSTRGRFTDTWIKQSDGTWRCVAGHFTRLSQS